MAIENSYLPPKLFASTVFEAKPKPRTSCKAGTYLNRYRTPDHRKQGNLLMRGSSAVVDQRIVEEDPSGRDDRWKADRSYIYQDFDGGKPASGQEVAYRHERRIYGNYHYRR